ncbi:cytokine-like nuclear factor N-PAC [Mytilus trossulus]|uniref:cytokine-like nuclear factor N-PAC n=1 Tax=Mytilus trossulus TaxID=6551 RepID=UPI00300718D9
MHHSASKMESKFEVGDLVWAKMKGFPSWPGKVIAPKDEVKKPLKKTLHHFVFFFGSENYAWIPEENIYLYAANRNKFKLNSRIPKGYKEALEAIEDEVKAQPATKNSRTLELPSIDEELAQIFPGSSDSPIKDYSREPMAGKKPKLKKDATTVKDKKERKSIGTGTVGRPPKVKDETSRKSTGSLPVKKRMSSLSEEELKAKKQKLFAEGRMNTKIKAKPSTNSVQDIPMDVNQEDLPLSPPRESPTKSPNSSTHNKSAPGLLIEEAVKKPLKPIIPTPLRIGFLGLGIMGQGMVMNLLRSGHEVTVWNRTAQKCKEFISAGAFKGNNPAEVVQACDMTFACVSDSTAVKDLVFGNFGVLQGITKGKCYIEMSTIDEDTMQDVAEAINARGGVFLESPVVGSRVPALEGQLIILASGDRKLFDDCYTCFEAIAKKFLFLGPEIGGATRMKLIVNMIMGTTMASLAEGMAMAEKVGLDQEDVAEVLSLGSLSCPTVIHKSQAILNQKYDPHFPLMHQQKDLRLALLLGDKVEQPLYVASAANELYKKARRLGYAESDIAAVYRAASS